MNYSLNIRRAEPRRHGFRGPAREKKARFEPSGSSAQVVRPLPYDVSELEYGEVHGDDQPAEHHPEEAHEDRLEE